MGFPWWVLPIIITAICGGGLITKVFKDKATKKEISELIYTLLDAWDDGVITSSEAMAIMKEGKDVYLAVKEIQKANIKK